MTLRPSLILSSLFAALTCTVATTQPVPNPQPAALQYGEPLTIERAGAVIDAAEAEARRNGWQLAIAVVDPSGHLQYFRRMDNAQVGSVNVAIGKARTAAQFRRPTKVFQDAVAQGPANAYFLSLDGVVVAQGGIPLVSNNRIVGAIGVSGSTGDNDSIAASAGARALAAMKE